VVANLPWDLTVPEAALRCLEVDDLWFVESATVAPACCKILDEGNIDVAPRLVLNAPGADNQCPNNSELCGFFPQ